MTCEEAQELVKARLSHKRYKHTLNVKNMAVELALRYGADPDYRRYAGTTPILFPFIPLYHLCKEAKQEADQ